MRLIVVLTTSCILLITSCTLLLAGEKPLEENKTAKPPGQSEKLTPETPMGNMKAERRSLAHRKRRIIMNNDGHDLNSDQQSSMSVTPQTFLQQRTSPLLGSQVGAIFYGTQGPFNSYTLRSSGVTDVSDLSKNKWARELIQQGNDPLELITDFCHHNNMETFWSMRMNYTNTDSSKDTMPPWKLKHPDCLMGTRGSKFPFGSNRWTSLNYGLPEVREQVFKIFQDVCSRYDIDGVELDFCRWPVFFKPQMLGEPVTQEHRDMMTGLLAQIREMAEEIGRKRKHPLLISVHVTDSVSYNKAIGLDVERWLKDGLIDILVAGSANHFDPWEKITSLGHKYNVPVYIYLCNDRLANKKMEKDDLDLRVWRGQALKAWDAGADGIYVFNWSVPDHSIFRELGDPEILRKREHIYNNIFGEAFWANILKNGVSFRTIPANIKADPSKKESKGNGK